MTKLTITREESIQAVFDLKAGYTLGLADVEILKRVARIALAAMDSEPFAYIIQDKYERERGVEGHLSRSHVSKYVSQEDISEHEIACTPLYRHAKPAPTLPDRSIFEKWWESQNGAPLDGWDSLRTIDGYCDDGIDCQFEAWNACRAAMLQAGSDEIGSWSNGKNTPTVSSITPAAPVVTFYRDGIEAAAKWIDQQREAYDSEHGWSDHDTGSFEFGSEIKREYSSTLEELAEGIRALHPNAGNSPVIPDGYVMVPKEPTEDMCFAPDVPVGNKTWDGYQSSADMAECKAIYEAMLAAAPQEVK